MTKEIKFPLIEAFLVCPNEGKNGKIAICTNTVAPTMAINEIPFSLRKDLAVMGSLIVNRDGAERMILNSLAHPTLEYIILFGQETLSFCPSTNLLSALMHGYKEEKNNVIAKGRGVAHQYPSIPKKILDLFRQRFKVLPLYNHQGADEIIQQYLQWAESRIPKEVLELVKKIREKKSIYYDSLTELIELLQKIKPTGVSAIQLDPKDFQHLQPPIIELEDTEEKLTEVNFEVKTNEEKITIDFDDGNKLYTITGTDSWLLAYSLMIFMNENKITIPVKHQLLLGAELSRAEMQIKNNINTENYVISKCKQGERTQIPFLSKALLKPDKQYYYKIGIKNSKIYVQSLAHDTCTQVFELRAKNINTILEKLARENRFQDYEQQFLHRADVGIETGRAGIALNTGHDYFQDFRSLFKINKTEFPLIAVEGDNFLSVHQKIITALYTRGLTAPHPDAHKGTMRAATILATFRNASKALEHFPQIYSSGTITTYEMRTAYKKQLQSPHNDGTYTYGSRTRAHFGYDQLDKTVNELKNNKNKTAIIQRFDFTQDMTLKETEVFDTNGNKKTKTEATKDPCLTHDIYFIENDKLHCFHIARAHNIVNAYPENIFGLYDAYDSYIAKKLKIETGDIFMLSRGNILLLTEEQKAKKLIAEPSKPSETTDSSTVTELTGSSDFPSKGIAYYKTQLQETEKTNHPCAMILENYNGTDIIEKAANYLKKRGAAHNNPIIGTYDPESSQTDEQRRLAYLQCNENAGKLQATAVFIDGNKEKLSKDIELCNYIATKYKNITNVPLGNLVMFYVPIRENSER